VLRGNADICREQILSGMAWHFKKHENEQASEDRAAYAQAERTARSRRAGLWRDGIPVPPWEFRKSKADMNAHRGTEGINH
jgi:endonuclease YncB( thermonuclease family)